MKSVWRVHSEWDIGHEQIVFETEEKAEEWVRQNPHIIDILADWELDDGDDPRTLQHLTDDGLISFEEIEVQ